MESRPKITINNCMRLVISAILLMVAFFTGLQLAMGPGSWSTNITFDVLAIVSSLRTFYCWRIGK